MIHETSPKWGLVLDEKFELVSVFFLMILKAYKKIEIKSRIALYYQLCYI